MLEVPAIAALTILVLALFVGIDTGPRQMAAAMGDAERRLSQ